MTRIQKIVNDFELPDHILVSVKNDSNIISVKDTRKNKSTYFSVKSTATEAEVVQSIQAGIRRL